MDDKFKLSDMGHPLYEYSQIITEQDLHAFRQALTRQYKSIPWYKPVTRWATGVAIGVVIGLITWVREGKGGIR